MAVSDPPRRDPPRYEALVKLASGGMATVFVGAARGALGFRQLVAIKRPHPHLVEDPGFRDALLAEARVASRIRHANVVDVRDVEVAGDAIQLVMDYVEGASLGQLILHGARTGARIPPGVAVRVVLDACAGLAAAHDLTDESGAPLGLVHRDVSPQNILVGLDGIARVADFGVAKEARAVRATTTEGALKGKIGYIAPEYIRGLPIDRRADVFAMGVVLWEALAHKRLFRGSNEAEALDLALRGDAPPVSRYAEGAGEALDAVIARAVAKEPDDRFASARDLAEALESAARPAGLVASYDEVARVVRAAVGDELEERRAIVRERLAASEGGSLDPLPPSAPAIERTPSAAATTVALPGPRRRARRARTIALGASIGASAIAALVAVVVLGRDTDPPPAAPSASSIVEAAPAASAVETATASAEPPAPAASSASSAHASPAAPSASIAPSARSPGAPAKRAPKRFPANPYR